MGIQSTHSITREQAEKMYLDDYAVINEERIKREARIMTDQELEDALEHTFDNYSITSTPDE